MPTGPISPCKLDSPPRRVDDSHAVGEERKLDILDVE
jgi:hypothetical protein